jgi:G protein-coupled receptor Mth (Methuselah protein)
VIRFNFSRHSQLYLTINFSILFCIFWLNVMCYDIWKAFKSVRNPLYPKDSQKFLIYLFYGFGLPIIITMILAVIDETSLFPEKWRPQIGKFECFLRNDRDIEFFYLYLPMSLILIVNVILYSITAYKIYTVQNDKFILSGKVTRRRVVSCNPIRLRFLLYLRLFLLMGELNARK